LRLVEKYRPKAFDDVAGQANAVARLKRLIEKGIGGRALLFEGPSGAGKTSLAYVVGRSLGIVKDGETLESLMEGQNLDVRFYRANEMTQREVEELHTWIRFWPLGEMKMVIIDEAQTMTSGAQSGLLSLLETLPETTVFLLTTTEAALQEDLFGNATPFGSRCKRIAFEAPSREAIAQRLAFIAWSETGDGAALPYAEIVRQGKGNLRKCIDLLEDALLDAPET